MFRGVPGFLEGVPGCSGFFTLFRGVPGCSGVPCSGVPGITTCHDQEMKINQKPQQVNTKNIVNRALNV